MCLWCVCTAWCNYFMKETHKYMNYVALNMSHIRISQIKKYWNLYVVKLHDIQMHWSKWSNCCLWLSYLCGTYLSQIFQCFCYKQVSEINVRGLYSCIWCNAYRLVKQLIQNLWVKLLSVALIFMCHLFVTNIHIYVNVFVTRGKQIFIGETVCLWNFCLWLSYSCVTYL